MSLSSRGRMRLVEACRAAMPASLPEHEREGLEQYLLSLATGAAHVPKRGRGFNWQRIGVEAGVSVEALVEFREHLLPVLRAYALPAQHRKSEHSPARAELGDGQPRRRPGRRPLAIVTLPAADPEPWDDPECFRAALDLHMRRHGDTAYMLHRALVARGGRVALSTLATWRRGGKAPRSVESLRIFKLIEARYALPDGYFLSKQQREPKAIRRPAIKGVRPPEMRRLTWHLPDDFEDRPAAQQAEILAWVREVIINGSTDYRRFQAASLKHRYGLQFVVPGSRFRGSRGGAGVPPGAVSAGHPLAAPGGLNREMAALVAFKRDVLTAPGFKRSGVWNEATADQRTEHLGLVFGAMAATPHGPLGGLGVPMEDLSFAMLVFPAVWDWYVRWRERRRGFYTRWEVDLLCLGVALTREGTGWIRQNPALADRLRPIEGLITKKDVAEARADWPAACERMHGHGLARMKEIERVARVHRDPFEPILPVLEADSPLAEYRKITDEIARRTPDERRYPKAAAEVVRAFLMLRLGLHTGLRQRNLRELMLCPRGQPPRSERWLADNRRGELRWSDRDGAWEVYIPAVAFKNAKSSFFGNRPFHLLLPDLADLKANIEAYVARHRRTLLAGALDPGTFFVKSVKMSSRGAAYDQTSFYEAWRLAIQRYGIFNPYTGRGAIPGLLPHGPHNVRDVLATHILKQTGSYEQASYAIQDTPEMVAHHYGRFLPQDKASLAAKVLNKVWV